VTRGTRPKKSSSSRGFAREARGAQGAWGFWRLKTENRKLKILNFQAGNNYQKKIIFYFYFIFSRVRADSRLRPQGWGEEREGEGRGGRRGDAHVRVDTGVKPVRG
jgi:hypothetical protein